MNNCRVGIATTGTKFRSKFKGSPENVVNFFNGVAQEVREIMASLGVAMMNDLIGCTQYLVQKELASQSSLRFRDFSRVACVGHLPSKNGQ